MYDHPIKYWMECYLVGSQIDLDTVRISQKPDSFLTRVDLDAKIADGNRQSGSIRINIDIFGRESALIRILFGCI